MPSTCLPAAVPRLAAACAAVLMLTAALVVTPPRAGQAAGAPARLDRVLRALQAQRATAGLAPGATSAAGQTGQPEVDVVVQSTRDVSRDLAAAGARVRTNLGAAAVRVHTARLPVAALDRAAAIPGVVQVSASRALTPLLDTSTGEAHTQAQSVWSGVQDAAGQPVTGKGVLVAVVDTGLDWSHPDFVTAGGHTRLLALWDQTATPASPPSGFDYGREWSRAAVDAWLAAGVHPGDPCAAAACLAAGATGAPAEADDLTGAGGGAPGHGTHVAGIAAANGLAATGGTPAAYKGMAPDATLLVVKSDLTTAHVIDAWRWIVARAQAAGQPVAVVNSFGAHLGAHDGTHDLEAALDALSGPGVVFTVAAGNSGADQSHGAGEARLASPPVPSTAKIMFNQASGIALSTAALDLWYRSADTLSLALLAPDGSVLGPVAKGAAGTFTYTPTNTTVTLDQNEPVPAGSQSVHASITLSRPSPSALQDTWTVVVTAAGLGPVAPGPSPGRWDAWIDSAATGGLVWLDPAAAGTSGGLDLGDTLAEPATARRAVVAGAYVSKVAWTNYAGQVLDHGGQVAAGSLAAFTSRGPTRDGRQKPDLVAPGQWVVAPLSSSFSFVQGNNYPRFNPGSANVVGPNQRHRVLQGTSMAAAHVAGAVALLLQARPALTPEEALALLREHALRDAATGLAGGGTWSPTSGAGKLRALAPVQAALALPPAAPTATTGASTASATPTPSPPATLTMTPTVTATALPSATATPAATRTPTPARTATATRTPTATPVNELIVRLDLQRAVPPPAASYVVDVTLAIYPNGSVPGSRTPVATYVARTDATGGFEVLVAGGLEGRYDFVAKPAGALSRELNSVFLQKGVAETLRFPAFQDGDATGDDAVDAADLGVLRAAYGTAGGDTAFDPRADFDGDGRVSLLDFSRLAGGYGLAGPQAD